MKKYVCAILLALGIGIAVPQSAQASTGAGYNLYYGDLQGSPYVQHVTLDATAYNAKALDPVLRSIVGQLHSYGEAIQYDGFSTTAPFDGHIQVRAYNAPACVKGGTGYLAYTPVTFGVNQTTSALYIWHSSLILCPQAYKSLSLTAMTGVLRHEMGHTQGLAHFDTTSGGTYQMMRSSLDGSTYKSGDVNGFRELARRSVLQRAAGA